VSGRLRGPGTCPCHFFGDNPTGVGGALQPMLPVAGTVSPPRPFFLHSQRHRDHARPPSCRGAVAFANQPKEIEMHSIIYIVGLIVVVLAVLSFVGLA